MIGALINAAGVLAGGLLGLLLKKALPKRLEQPIMAAEGLGVIVIALLGVFSLMLTVTPQGKISSSGELLLLVSLVIGTILGELLNIDRGIKKISDKLETKFNREGFSERFVSATMIFCVGALVEMGPLTEQLYDDMTLILFKTMLDTITAALLAVSLGYGVLFAAAPVLIIEGLVGLLAGAISNIPDIVIDDFCMVGYILVLCIGLNFVFKTKIKTANMLPALLVPIIYHILI